VISDFQIFIRHDPDYFVPIYQETQQYAFLDLINKTILWTMILWNYYYLQILHFDPIKFVLNIPSNLDLE